MRLFAAVVPTDEVVRELTGAVRGPAALPGADGLRWNAAVDWHVTVAFYGEVPDDGLPALRAGLVRAAAGTRPFTLGLTGTGTFGDRVLWAGVGGDVPALTRLAGTVPPGASGHDGYRPHLTLARAPRGGAGLAPWTAALAGLRTSPWEVTRLALMGSETGHPYSTEATWPLGVPLVP
ncbi:RNA 2',3'-cyclic phosphodiesterase [Streptomyces sp. RFCAC02]|uniref:RNA 2',3'-cyclic phosphodiesterase n=1 Tax=Streptomyces sp. RFCAC02 TaxID=2499143 RepID=UPI00143DED48|nr:RNA 2',3'-cyclic phosphodiesterase [Streptomyces sp. RFCAC02]